jgi:hypothetical protein
MSVTPEFVKRELTKLEKKVQANETTRKEALDMLDKADSTKLSLQREEVALRTLAAGGVPKVARIALAQQLADVMKVSFDETSIMELIAKYDKQDVTNPPSEKPTVSKVAKVSAPKIEVTTEEVPKVEVETEGAPKKRGRPALTDEQKAENARKRALAAVATAAPPPVEAEEDPVEEEDEYFDPDAYEDE